MIVGFNHNILYQGVGFHVQTEDSGLKSPSLVTLLYHGGTIVSSQKTSYADILDVDNLNHVVEELAKEQHKGMLRRLTKGEFDQRICELGIQIESCQLVKKDEIPVLGKPVVNELAPPAEVVEEIVASAPEVIESVADDFADAAEPQGKKAFADDDQLVAIEPAYEPPSAEDRNQYQDISGALDDLIFSYLTGGDEKG